MIRFERIEDRERFPHTYLVYRDEKPIGSVAYTRGGWEAGLPSGEYIARGTFSSKESAAAALSNHSRNQ